MVLCTKIGQQMYNYDKTLSLQKNGKRCLQILLVIISVDLAVVLLVFSKTFTLSFLFHLFYPKF